MKNSIFVILFTLISNSIFSQNAIIIGTLDTRSPVERQVDALDRYAKKQQNIYDQVQNELTKLLYEGYDVVNQKLEQGADKSILDYYEKGYNKIYSEKIDPYDSQSVFEAKLKIKRLISTLYSYQPKVAETAPRYQSKVAETAPRYKSNSEENISTYYLGKRYRTTSTSVLWDSCDFAKSGIITEISSNQEIEIITKCDTFYLVRLPNGVKGYLGVKHVSTF